MDTPTRPPATKRTVPAKARKASRGRTIASSIGRPSWFVAKCMMPLLLLLLAAASLLYVRLLNGPISLSFLAAPIGRSIAAEMPGVNVAIEDALVRLTESGSVEFRLRNVRFNDTDGAPIGIAPLAAVSMSSAALWSGHLAPDKVVLIEPRLLLVYSEQGGISVSFPKTVDVRAAAPASPAADDDALTALQRIDIARLIAEAGQRARRGADAASFLRAIGVRNATVILDRSGRQSIWTVLEADVDLEHRKKRSTVTGTASIASAGGPWGMTFKIDEAEKSNSVSFEATVRDFVPRSFASVLPDVPGLGMLDAPLSGEARLELHPDGSVLGGELKLYLGRGALVMPGIEARSVPLDGGRLDLTFDPQARRVAIGPSSLRWNQGSATIVGTASAVDNGGGGHEWAVDIKSTKGQILGDEFAVPTVDLDEVVLQGRYVPDTSLFRITQARMRAGGSQVEATGEISMLPGSPSLRLDGRLGAATADVVKAVWPSLLGPGARRWVGRQVTKGRVIGGTFKAAITAPNGIVTPESRQVSMTLEAADFSFIPGKGLAPVDVPRALLRIEGDSLEISMPEVTSQLASNRRVAMKGGRFTAVAIYDEPTLGEIAFRFQSPVAAAADYLEQEALGIGSLGLPADGLDGRVEGQLKINLPLVAGVTLADMKIEGKARVTDGRVKQLIGPHDVQGATINIDVGDGAVNATGQMLVGGVHAKLAFQRFLDAPAEKQPPLRLSSTLDASDRNQLGLDVNHLVNGDVPVEAAIVRGPGGELQIRVHADVSGAELVIEPLAWRKAPGRQALVEFDVVRQQKARTELQNFKVVGDDIAIDGALAFDGKGRLVDFHFPNFALTLVSRMELQGVVRPDNVWDVKARGAYWDGREFFRQLFAVGQGPEKPAPARKDQPGLDLKADIDNVLGHGDISLKGLRLQLSRRGQKLAGMIARGNVEGGKPIEVGMQQTSNEPRKLVVLTEDAGQAFRMVGFYPNMLGGQMRLDINLDGKGPAEKTGLLDVRNFSILGDAVVSEVLQSPEQQRTNEETGKRPRRRIERQSIEFNLMQAPFSVGYNQLVLEGAQLRGPLLGASIAGKADFKMQHVDIVGSYAPLQGLNAALSDFPMMGQLLTGPKGEGVVGITFRILGPMAQPQVLVNPLSLILPGAFRGLSEMSPASSRIIPRDEKPPVAPKVKLPQAPVGGDAIRQPAGKAPRVVAPEVTGGWSTDLKSGKN